MEKQLNSKDPKKPYNVFGLKICRVNPMLRWWDGKK